MEYPNYFPRIVSPSIISYNFTDISDGSGIVVFNAAHTKEQTTDNYIMTQQSNKSNNPYTRASVSSTSATKSLDIDFDILIGQQRTIKGTFMAEVALWGARQTTDISVYTIVKLRKWDGTTETDIASAQSETLSITASSGTGSRTVVVQTDVSDTSIKLGETLRVTVEVYTTADGTGYHYVYLGHDPVGRTGFTDSDTSQTVFTGSDNYATTTISKFYIPFKIGA